MSAGVKSNLGPTTQALRGRLLALRTMLSQIVSSLDALSFSDQERRMLAHDARGVAWTLEVLIERLEEMEEKDG